MSEPVEDTTGSSRGGRSGSTPRSRAGSDDSPTESGKTAKSTGRQVGDSGTRPQSASPGDAGTAAARPAKKQRRGPRGGSAGASRSTQGEATAGDDAARSGATGAEAGVGDPSSGKGPSGGTVGPSPLPGSPPRPKGTPKSRQPDELPERIFEGRPKSAEAAEKALVKRPKIGDTRPAPGPAPTPGSPRSAPSARGGRSKSEGGTNTGGGSRGGTRSGGRSKSEGGAKTGSGSGAKPGGDGKAARGDKRRKAAGSAPRGERGSGTKGAGAQKPVEAALPIEALELDEATMRSRKGRERKGRPVGRYMMVVSVQPEATQIAVLEGRNLIEHYVSRPADDVFQIHGNIYLGRVQNVLPGMEAAFVDIGTPKNAVLYRGDVQYDAEDIEEGGNLKIEEILKAKQNVLCQVTKNPIGHKGARLTQEVSLPGRVVVLIPNSKTYGISKRLADDERRRLRRVLDKVKPAEHGIIVRTAAESVTAEEIERDVTQLVAQWAQIEALTRSVKAPALLYREPDMAVRVIREEFNNDYRGIVIDDPALHEEVRSYVGAISPALSDRVQLYDTAAEPLSVFERYHVHEQLHRALDRKVWLPSGGSLIIEHTEALTVIDVNTGKNVGSSSLEETVFKNNLEAADEIAKQLRLRDIGGIIVCDFIDMEIEENRRAVIKAFRSALARDKTRTQVFNISELGLVEMTRKRIGEGLLESLSGLCEACEGRGVLIHHDLLA